MVRRWVNLVGVTPLLLGIMVSVPQMVVAPLVLAQTSQSGQQTEAQRLYREGERLRGQGTRESFQQALAKYQQALPLFQASGDRNGEADNLDSIGRVYNSIHQPQQALNFYQQALSLWRQTGNRSGEAMTLGNIGNVYRDTGQPQQALNFYQQALPIFREVGDRSREAITLGNIGNIYRDTGQPQQALNFYQQALLIFREVGDSQEERLRQRRGEANALIGIGNVYLGIGQPQQALNFYQQALPIFREVGDRIGEAITLGNIGNVYRDIGQSQQALNFYQQALPIFSKIGDRAGEANTLIGIGNVYSDIGQPQQALNFLRQALPISREVGDRFEEALTLNNIGSVYRRTEQPQQALNFYQQALPIRREVGDRSGEATTLTNLALVQQALKNLPTALQNIQAAISIVEDIRGQLIDPDSRTSYFATVQDYYKLQIDLLMQLHQQNPSQGYNIQAFNVTERSKARTLLELLTESRADIRTGVDPQLLQQEQNIQTQLAAMEQRRRELANSSTNANKEQIAEEITALEAQRATLQTQFRDLQSQIRATSPRYAALKYPEPLTLEQIQQQILDDNTLILSYSLGKDQSYLWLISKTEMTSYQLPNQKIIEDLVDKKALSQFTNNRTSRERVLIYTSEVSNVLLRPVIEKIGNKRLVIISDGALQLLPLGALHDLRAENNQYQPLLINNEVNYLPSASTLQIIRTEAQNRPPAPRSIALLADPVFTANDPRVNRGATTAVTPNELSLANTVFAAASRSARGGDWSRLPYTLQEAETIRKLFSPDRSLFFLDFNATRANAQSDQLAQYRFIHWATHGFVNTEKPELSGIVMSLVQENGQPQDGYLLLGDIFNLNFNADLVVLSACETGLGEVIQGEGLIGLTRGLMYAGTSRVVTSLWAVPDDQTAILMGNFYEKMLQQNLPPAEALRAAQLETFRTPGKWAPYHWAAFTFQGEWR